MRIVYSVTLLVVLLCSEYSFSQVVSPRVSSIRMDYKEDDDSFFYALDSIKNVTPSIEVGNDYTNKVLFWGRDFGLNQFGFEPRITFKTGKGLYVYASQYYWSALTNPWAKTDFGIGMSSVRRAAGTGG